MITKKGFGISLRPKKLNIFPKIGIGISSFLIAIIDMKGTIAAIENDSKIPFMICKKIKANLNLSFLA